jgi:hypothetical protein
MPTKTRKPPWKKKNPRKTADKSSRKLLSAQKERARTRAKRAGRRDPNLIDNMWVSQRG